MSRAAIYLRQSEDKTGEREGVERQRDRTTKLVEARGWELVDEYVDNSVSASKARGAGTAWARLLEDARAGKFTHVVAVDLDRLLRQTRDLTDLIDTGARVVTVDGEIDLSTADGEFRATMLAGIARFEVRRKSERQKRANQKRRESGEPPKTVKVLGYAEDAQPVIPEEAQAIREAHRKFLAGANLTTIAKDLNTAGYQTSKHRAWTAATVRDLLSNPRYAGFNTAHGDIAEMWRGNWEPIISEATWRASREKVTHPDRLLAMSNKVRWLLSGLAYCGVCGGRNIRVGKTTNGLPAYRCNDRAHMSRKAEPINDYVNAVIVARLSLPDAVMLMRRDDVDDTEALQDERAALQSRLDGLAALFAAGTLTAKGVTEASERLREQIAALDEKLSDAGRVDLLADVVTADDVSAAWEALDIDRQRAILDALMTVTIHPVGRGRHWTFNPDSVGIDWK